MSVTGVSVRVETVPKVVSLEPSDIINYVTKNPVPLVDTNR